MIPFVSTGGTRTKKSPADVAPSFKRSKSTTSAPRRGPLVCAHQTQLLGQMLYYVLTTGSGQQTLGEEYCDITQVSGQYGLPPTPARRALFIVYQTAFLYIAERISFRVASRGITLADAYSDESYGVNPLENNGGEGGSRFEAHLDQSSNAKFESELHYDRSVSDTILYDQIGVLSGFSAQELFLWFPVKEIHADVPSSEIIYFDIGVVSKQFSLSLLETPSDCTAVKYWTSSGTARRSPTCSPRVDSVFNFPVYRISITVRQVPENPIGID